MTLVCPVGDPPGVGTPYCRICGRDYMEASDAAVVRAAVTVPAQAAEVVELPVAVLAGAAAPESLGEDAFDLERFAMRITGAHEVPFIPAPSAPVEAVVPQPDAAPAVEPAAVEDAPEVATVAPSTVERRLLVLAAGAAFVAGLVVGAGAVAGLG